MEHQSFRGASAASENSRQATFSGSYSIVFTPKVGLCIYKFKLWSSSASSIRLLLSGVSLHRACFIEIDWSETVDYQRESHLQLARASSFRFPAIRAVTIHHDIALAPPEQVVTLSEHQASLHPMQRSSAVSLNEDSHAYRAPKPSSATIRMEMSVEINPLLLVSPLLTTPPKIDDLIDY